MSLRDIGFDSTDEQVYLILLRDPGVSVGEIGELVSVMAPDVHACLNRLAELGVIRFGVDGIVVSAPSLTIGRLVERTEDELMDTYRRVSDVRTEIHTLEERYGHREQVRVATPAFERIEGLDQVRERIDELSFFCRASLDSIQPGGPQSKEAIEASRPLDRRAARRGIAMRLMLEQSVLGDEMNRAHLHELAAMGVKIRFADRPFDRMLIFDGAVAVVPVESGNSRRGALVVREPSLVSGLEELFEGVWSAAQVLELDTSESEEVSGDQLTQAELEVLAMLSAGTTDEAIARRLGISVRHLRRRVGHILAVLGVGSRFGAGVEAARRGLL